MLEPSPHNDKPADILQVGPIIFHFHQQRITVYGQHVPHYI